MTAVEKGKCYRIEERIVIPGPRVTVKQVGGGFNGATTEVEQNRCFIIVNGRTERYIGRNNLEVSSSSALRPDQFFTSAAEAEAYATLYHLKHCPHPTTCGWAQGD